MTDDEPVRDFIDRLARHAVTTTLAAALLIAATGIVLWPRGSDPGQPVQRTTHRTVTLDGWPLDGAAGTVWLEDGSQVTLEFGVPTALADPVQAAVLTRAAADPLSWAECSITIDGERVSSARVEMPEAPASCAWPE